MKMSVNDSQFYMWRTLFSVAHADDVVTDEEVQFMAYILEDINFSEEQTKILKDDIVTPKNVEAMFAGITDQNDRIRFFEFARDLVWVDGDFGPEEQSVMMKLQKTHMKELDIDNLVGHVGLQFEEEKDYTSGRPGGADGLTEKHGVFSAFSRRFLRLIGGE